MPEIDIEAMMRELAALKAEHAAVIVERDQLKAASEATKSQITTRDDKINRLQALLFENLMSGGDHKTVAPAATPSGAPSPSDEPDALKAALAYSIPPASSQAVKGGA